MGAVMNSPERSCGDSTARLAAAIVLTVLSASAAHAEPIMHRSAVPAGEAVPTGGSFSILFPIAFSDPEIRAEDPPAPTLATHLLMGVSAMEMPGPEITKPIDGLMEAAKTRPGTTVSEISRAQTGDMETLSFALTEPKGRQFFSADSSQRHGIRAGHPVSRGASQQGDPAEGRLFRIIQDYASVTADHEHHVPQTIYEY
jgi:hypothetical protein